MAAIHVLEANTKGFYKVVVHEEITAGNNSVSKSWQSCYLEALKIRHLKDDGTTIIIPVDSVLIEGEDGHSWQVSAAERAQVQSGALMEILLSLRLGPDITIPALLALASVEVDEFKNNLSTRLKYYGFTNG